jgi:hypothetical protein
VHLKPTLIIISAPFQRLIKTHLSKNFLDALKINGDILVIAPFADNEDFLDSYKGAVTNFIKYENNHFLKVFKSAIYLVIKTLRMNGYWRSNPEYMGYYIANQYTKFGNNGNDKRVNFIQRIGINLLGFIGCRWKNSWQALAKILPINYSFKKNIIENCSAYKKILIIQACSWGEQDLELAILAKKYGWKSILVPYTTDQLLCNGWLYADYSAICVQGPLEKEYAMRFHRIPIEKLVELGSINFRKLNSYANKLNERDFNHQKIIYAGSIGRYFPLESELEGLEVILNAQILGKIPNFEIIYRSFGEDREKIEKLRSKYEFKNKFSIDYVSDIFSGMEKYCGEITEVAMKEYIQKLNQASLLVTVGCTSLTLDAAFFGVPTISYWEDKSGIILRRNTEKLLTNNYKLRDIYRQVPAAFSEKELIGLINEYTHVKASKKKNVKSIIEEWDFPDVDSYQLLSNTVLKVIS